MDSIEKINQPATDREEVHVLTRNGVMIAYFKAEDKAKAFAQVIKEADKSPFNWSIETGADYKGPFLIFKDADREVTMIYQLHKLSEYVPSGD